MGICERENNTQNFINNDIEVEFNSEINLKNLSDSLYSKALSIFIDQSNNCIGEIMIENTTIGVGFLCKIPFYDFNNLLPVFITGYHILEKSNIIKNKNLKLSFKNGGIVNIELYNTRKKYFSEKYDISIIEIKRNDFYTPLFKFEDLDENYEHIGLGLLNNGKNYIYFIENNKKPKIYFGIIKNIINNGFEYLCTNDKLYLEIGSPIFNILNHKIIGINLEKNENNKIRKGRTLKLPVEEFYKQDQENKNKKILENENYIKNKLEVNPDDIITKLLNNDFDLKEYEINYIIEKSLILIKNENTLLKLNPPLIIVGDLIGQFNDLKNIFDKVGFPDKSNFLFLGNYVDYSQNGIEILILLLCYKIKYPSKISLLRGKHEQYDRNRIYGFYDECKKKYDLNLYKKFNDLFNYLPVAALIKEKIFCVHGGLSPELKNIQMINNFKRPITELDDGLICDLINSELYTRDDISFDEKDHGISFLYGNKAVKEFNNKKNINIIIKGNQVEDFGYEFYCDGQILALFSASNFQDFENKAAIANIDLNLNINTIILGN